MDTSTVLHDYMYNRTTVRETSKTASTTVSQLPDFGPCDYAFLWYTLVIENRCLTRCCFTKLKVGSHTLQYKYTLTLHCDYNHK